MFGWLRSLFRKAKASEDVVHDEPEEKLDEVAIKRHQVERRHSKRG